ncbi:hypothetical protein [Rubellimicrobium roseum]|uniref:Uncharacterized protein n=1 Tax=Rubellimicrobium roseum TaxID=687525 RepID=A0A5C4NES5_9RHOB|nr:hypothetical protein [Rubellimicrobium roseum]TNC72440.1 hypothetical protein FHG71_08620 [Rubellimicrobium roseum]
MIVYSDRRRRVAPREFLERLIRSFGAPRHDTLALLVETGVLEAGVADALCPEEDHQGEGLAELRAAMLDLARALRGDADRLVSARKRLAGIAARLSPEPVEVSEPEGFAFYALYPETYAEAARRFLRAEQPERAMVVGLRSIGTTLSAVVAAELEAQGVEVTSFTVRPRGHPWDRKLRLSPELRAGLGQGGPVLIVDEGPGISGSSFASVAEAASEAGVPDDRIHLFPSWDSDGSGLRSERARAVWPRVKRWVVSFEETFLDTGRLAAAWGGGGLRDISGGLWREVVPSCRDVAVQPQHERRKYLLERGDGTPLLLKFVGLGDRGHRALARAEIQAADGFASPVAGLRDGFLAQEWVKGHPAGSALHARTAEDTGSNWSATMGRYLGHLATQTKGAARFDDILAMVRLNVGEGLGGEALGHVAWLERMRAAVEARPAVAVDGRMLPQEWLRSEAGERLKCDGLDHHDDHFWPGAQDIAWDLAGAMVEWGMEPEAREALLQHYESCSEIRPGARDDGAREVLHFYEATYLAYRLGYTTLAAETLGSGEDGCRMARDRDRYAGLLRAALERGA